MIDPNDPQGAIYRELFQQATGRVEQDAPPPTTVPRWPLVSGVFHFPWYPATLGAWIGMSLGLILTGLGFCVLLGPAAQAGVIGIRAMGPPVAMLTILALSYASACCLHVIENTANGADSIDAWPVADWREWVWSFASLLYVFMICALAGYGLRLAVLPVLDTWLPSAIMIFLLFPFVLLSSLAAESRWWPYAPVIVRSIGTVPIQWLMFYGFVIALCGGWLAVFVAGILMNPWGAMFAVMPLLAAVMLIYARLLGRLAWCTGRIESSDAQE